MKIRLTLLAFLLPLIAIGAVVAAAFWMPRFPPGVVIDLAYLGTVILGVRLLKHKIVWSNVKIGIKDCLSALLLGLLLFGSFYFEKVVLQDYQKKEFGVYASISAVILSPILEEFFTKALLFDNLKKVIQNPFFTIGITALYFWVLHFPMIMISHLLIGFTTATVYYFRKNLVQVIIIHSVYNVLVVGLQIF